MWALDQYAIEIDSTLDIQMKINIFIYGRWKFANITRSTFMGFIAFSVRGFSNDDKQVMKTLLYIYTRT